MKYKNCRSIFEVNQVRKLSIFSHLLFFSVVVHCITIQQYTAKISKVGCDRFFFSVDYYSTTYLDRLGITRNRIFRFLCITEPKNGGFGKLNQGFLYFLTLMKQSMPDDFKKKYQIWKKNSIQNEENMDVGKPEIQLGFFGNSRSVTTLYIFFDTYYNTNNS